MSILKLDQVEISTKFLSVLSIKNKYASQCEFLINNSSRYLIHALLQLQAQQHKKSTGKSATVSFILK